MQTAVCYNSDLRYDHARWENKLNFYKQEIKLFEAHLGQLLQRDMTDEAKARIEQFQNQFIRQKEVADELKHLIHLHEDDIMSSAGDEIVQEPDKHLPKHQEMAQRMHTYQRQYNTLQTRFNTFLVEQRP